MKTAMFTCDETGAVKQQSTVEVEDTDGDPADWDLPADWAEITIRTAVPNQDLADQVEAWRARRKEFDQTMAAQVKKGTITADQAAVMATTVDSEDPKPEGAAYVVEERVLHLSGNAFARLVRALPKSYPNV
jgi:hypothetical protein